MYFTVSMAVCSMSTFAPSFLYHHWNLSASELGIVAAMSGVLFLGSLAWSTVSDHYQQPRVIAIGCTLAYATFMMGLLWMPVDRRIAMAWTATMFGISNFFLAALFPIVDAEVLSRLGGSKKAKEHGSSFGKLRLWGTLGHTAATLASAGAIKKLKYPGMFGLMLASCASFIVSVMIGIKTRDTTSTRATSVSDRSLMRRRLMLILKNGRFMAFLGIVMVIGWVRAVLAFWLAFHFHVNLDRDPYLIALCSVVRTISELVILYFGKSLTTTIGSKGMLAVCQIAGILRLAAYGWVDLSGERWFLSFLFELLKGIATASFTASAVELTNYLVTGTNKRDTLIPLTEEPKDIANMSTTSVSSTSHLQLDPATEKLRQESKTLAMGCLYGTYNGLSSAVAGLTGSAILKYCTTNNDIAALFRIATVVATTSFVLYTWLVMKSK